MQTDRVNLLGCARRDLEQFFAEIGEKPFRASQLLKWVHRRGVADFAAMTDLSRRLRTDLGGRAEIRAPRVVREQVSEDGTRKWLIAVDDRNCVETVYIPEDGRNTLCVSSQVGCPLSCSFCATGGQGLNRNLSASEIIGQLWLAERMLPVPAKGERAVSNVVLMGMGEPLLNFGSVAPALELMLEDCAYGLARRRVTVSTAGVVPVMDRLRERCPVSLAVSLHATEDTLRDRLVPLNKKYPLRELLSACRRYADADSRSRITFEYVLLDAVNDTPHHARQLVRLLSTVPAKVNLIPFNPYPGSTYKRPTDDSINAFRDILLAKGVMTITRRTRGDDIRAACGQLAGIVHRQRRRAAARAIPVSQSLGRVDASLPI